MSVGMEGHLTGVIILKRLLSRHARKAATAEMKVISSTVFSLKDEQ
jgi:hypothetical protein